MTDVIKEAGLSKGGIYLYYKDIDDILVDVMDKEFQANDFNRQLEMFHQEEGTLEEKIYKLLQLYAYYLQESSVLAGKLQFELTIMLTQNKERALKIREKVSMRKIGASFTSELSTIIRGSLCGRTELEKKADNIIDYIRCFLDGVLEIYVFQRCYQFGDGEINLGNIMNMLAENVIRMIDEKS